MITKAKSVRFAFSLSGSSRITSSAATVVSTALSNAGNTLRVPVRE